MVEKMKEEAMAVAKFLIGLQIKSRRTQLIVDLPGGKRQAVNCDYVHGTNLHLEILKNKDKIMKMVPTIDSINSLNELKSI